MAIPMTPAEKMTSGLVVTTDPPTRPTKPNEHGRSHLTNHGNFGLVAQVLSDRSLAEQERVAQTGLDLVGRVLPGMGCHELDALS